MVVCERACCTEPFTFGIKADVSLCYFFFISVCQRMSFFFPISHSGAHNKDSSFLGGLCGKTSCRTACTHEPDEHGDAHVVVIGTPPRQLLGSQLKVIKHFDCNANILFLKPRLVCMHNFPTCEIQQM
jgi:hypothetical protein